MLHYNIRMTTPRHAHADHGHSGQTHGHNHHDHAHHHSASAAAPVAGFSLIALSAPARLVLALPPLGVLWLLTVWALGHG